MATKSKHLEKQNVDTTVKDYVDLWALAFEYRTSLERLLGLNKELNTYLTNRNDDDSVDFAAAIEKFRQPLEAASAIRSAKEFSHRDRAQELFSKRYTRDPTNEDRAGPRAKYFRYCVGVQQVSVLQVVGSRPSGAARPSSEAVMVERAPS